MAVAIIREVLGSIVHTCPMSPVPTAHREAHTELALQPGTGPHLFTDMTDKLQHCAQGLKGARGQHHRTNSHPHRSPTPQFPRPGVQVPFACLIVSIVCVPGAAPSPGRQVPVPAST